MRTFRRLFFAALFAGLLAGFVVTAAHQLGTVPLILAAEVFEAAAEAPAAVGPDHGGATPSAHAHADGAVHDHAGGWEPADGIERATYTLLADLLAGVAYALVLVAALALRGGAVDWRRGLRWGLGGFTAFALAPGLGLPPEVPGTEAAPLLDRQFWWSATAVLTAGGLALLCLTRHLAWAALGAAFIVLPHLVGAPAPAGHASLAPEALAQRFAVLSTLANFVFWLVLGTAAGHLYGRAAARA